MKRKTIVHPSKRVAASNELSDSRFAGVNLVQVKTLQKKLQDVFDYLETLSDDTYQAVQGDSLSADLDVAIRQCSDAYNQLTGM